MKRALVSGISGQDGSFLAELLLAKGYQVFGLIRRVAAEHDQQRLWRISHLLEEPNFKLVSASLESYQSIHAAIDNIRPDEVYHLGAQSFVSYSFDDEFSTMLTNSTGTHNILAATHKIVPQARFYHAASSEMYGKVEETPQKETTRFHPRSVYGISKVAGFELTRHYRERYGMFACSGILFNHESERRGQQFVTRKITLHVAGILLGLCKELHLGNIEAKRDWGHAQDYVNAQFLMLQANKPDDWVVSTNETHSVREFLDVAFGCISVKEWHAYVKHAVTLDRPTEVDLLLGDSTKIRTELGWRPEISFTQMVERMVQHDIELLKRNPDLSKTLGKPL